MRPLTAGYGACMLLRTNQSLRVTSSARLRTLSAHLATRTVDSSRRRPLSGSSVSTSQAQVSTASAVSHWPVTVAVSLLAFVAGLSIEGRWSKKGRVPATHTSEHASVAVPQPDGASQGEVGPTDENESTPLAQSGASGQGAPSEKHADESATKSIETSQTNDGDGSLRSDGDDDFIEKPDLQPDDVQGWRDFAISLHETYRHKIQALQDVRAALAESNEDRDELKNQQYWLKLDSQRNADFVLEILCQRDTDKCLIRDDDILRVHPLEPPDGLFDTPIKATVLRILDKNDLTRSLIVNLEGQAPSDDEQQGEKQWDYVYDWLQDITKSLQQADQISPESFWNFLWSAGWFKCGFPSWSYPDRDKLYPRDEVNAIAARLRSTSDAGMERYRIPSHQSHIRPFTERLGNCSTTATVYPGDSDDDGKPRQVQVLVDTGAELTIIKKSHVPKGIPVLSISPITVSGFGGASRDLGERVALRMKLHGEDESKGIDIVTTAMVMEDTASKLGVELGTDVMKPLGPVIDLKTSVLRVTGQDGQIFETPIKYLREDDKIKDPTPQIGDSSASGEAPPTEKKTTGHATEKGA